VLLEVGGLPMAQLRKVQFEITPTDHDGIFIISGKFMGIELEKVQIDIPVISFST
jgi:Ras GTPase-activating-like protein IQGAP2/3/Ras GTPase-activating-like protein IQGAP1